MWTEEPLRVDVQMRTAEVGRAGKPGVKLMLERVGVGGGSRRGDKGRAASTLLFRD